jgi:hypothetical protein
MPQPVEEEVREVLLPYHGRIRLVVERAWTEWLSVEKFRSGSAMGAILYSRTVANYVFDAIARYAIAEFMNDTSVRLKVESQTINLFFKGGVCGRFKKGDDSKLGQNNPTFSSLLFEYVDGLLPGFPSETAKVEFIWLANEINTRLEQVLVVARDGDKLLWDYEIDKDSGAMTGTVIPFPVVPAGPTASDDNEELVKPKSPPAEKTIEDDE